MDEIAAHPEVLSRRRYVGLYQPHLRHLGHRDFERFARPGAQHVDPRVIGRHRRRLVAAHSRLRRFVNKHVAHRSRHPMRRLPTYAELDACVDLLESLVKEYVHLLTAQALVAVLPAWQYDWKAPFRTAWL